MKHKVEFAVPYSYIYMELVRRKTRDKFEIPVSTTIWHLEDERHALYALCGFSLKGKAKAVSPALAMLGKPCLDCKAIARAYISPKVADRGTPGITLRTYQDTRMKTMMGRGGDATFRQGVHTRVPMPLLFANGEKSKQIAKNN